jgi:[ribosomal protein S5]-alanine N-acetyltransferase
MSRVPVLDAPRLLLPPLVLADAAQVQVLFPHWEIVRYLAAVVPWPYPSDGACAYYRDLYLPAMERGEQWHWTLRLKAEPDRLIGAINLRKGEDENRGFWIGLPWQGRGLMTEATEAVEERDYVSGRLPAEVWDVTREEWNRRRGAPEKYSLPAGGRHVD